MVEKKYKDYFAPAGCFVKRNSIKKLLIDVFMNHVFTVTSLTKRASNSLQII